MGCYCQGAACVAEVCLSGAWRATLLLALLLLLLLLLLRVQVLLLSPAERSRVTAGKLFNLVSSDTNTVGDFCTMAYGFLSAPLRIGLTMVLLYRWDG